MALVRLLKWIQTETSWCDPLCLYAAFRILGASSVRYPLQCMPVAVTAGRTPLKVLVREIDENTITDRRSLGGRQIDY